MVGGCGADVVEETGQGYGGGQDGGEGGELLLHDYGCWFGGEGGQGVSEGGGGGGGRGKG